MFRLGFTNGFRKNEGKAISSGNDSSRSKNDASKSLDLPEEPKSRSHIPIDKPRTQDCLEISSVSTQRGSDDSSSDMSDIERNDVISEIESPMHGVDLLGLNEMQGNKNGVIGNQVNVLFERIESIIPESSRGKVDADLLKHHLKTYLEVNEHNMPSVDQITVKTRRDSSNEKVTIEFHDFKYKYKKEDEFNKKYKVVEGLMEKKGPKGSEIMTSGIAIKKTFVPERDYKMHKTGSMLKRIEVSVGAFGFEPKVNDTVLINGTKKFGDRESQEGTFGYSGELKRMTLLEGTKIQYGRYEDISTRSKYSGQGGTRVFGEIGRLEGTYMYDKEEKSMVLKNGTSMRLGESDVIYEDGKYIDPRR
ncbi:hypothetical protein HOG98_06765 [bacterium]|nr:hypothetical protein [bacterium]